MPWAIVTPDVDLSVRTLCRRAYPGHPHGCPNYGKGKEGCPPACKTIDKLIQLDKPVWAVWNTFLLSAHVAVMRTRHPQWSERQLCNMLYWQSTARKALRNEIRRFFRQADDKLVLVKNPEGAGVNMTSTMATVGINLEWPPTQIAYQIALIGSPVESEA